MPEDSQLDYTLPDGAWKDSFDKLCGSRSILREKNLITKNFQPILDSSVENSLDSPYLAARAQAQSKPKQKPKPPQPIFKTPVRIKRPAKRVKEKILAQELTVPAIDTAPVSVDQSLSNTIHPFKCSISPVVPWMHDEMPVRHRQLSDLQRFQGTPINPNMGVVDFQHDISPLVRNRNQLFPTQCNSSAMQKEFDEYFRKRSLLRKKAIEKRLTKRLTKARNSQAIAENPKDSENTETAVEDIRPEPAHTDEPVCVVAEISDDRHSVEKQKNVSKSKRKSAKSIAKATPKPSGTKKRSTKRVCILTESALDIETTSRKSKKSIDLTEEKSMENRKTKSKSKKKSSTTSNAVTFHDCVNDSTKSTNGQETTTKKVSLTQKRKRSSRITEGPSKKISVGNGQRKSTREVPQIIVEPAEANDKMASIIELNDSREMASSLTLQSPNVTDKELGARPVLQPGKWRKTLNIWRRTHYVPGDLRCSAQKKTASFYENSVEFVGITKFLGIRKSIHFKREPDLDDHRSRVLLYCNQRKEIEFAEMYPAKKMTQCKKIGEGVYGEVFINTIERRGCTVQSVLKIIPIEGSIEVNGETQKTFEQILPEIVISMELCNLGKDNKALNSTVGFVDVKKVGCVKGKYPAHLVKLWEDYDAKKQSENEHPCIFDDSQLFVVLELAYSGQDMESFIFNNAEQAYYSLLQIILTLAVGEEAIEFEHRDLHWGNVLVLPSEKTELTYRLNGDVFSVPTKGAVITIIDYTLSRMAVGGDCCHYNDLSSDEDLFSATGDYQFDIYRMMRDVLGNNWESYEPRTNVFWISYIIEKMLNGVKYKSSRSKAHKLYISKLTELKDTVLNYKSSVECARAVMGQHST